MSVNNDLGRLNDLLFDQMDRLSDVELSGSELSEEINRAKAIQGVATNIIGNGSLVLQAKKFTDDKWDAEAETPKMLEG